MPLKPSANSDTRHDATNSPAAINLNRAKYPPPLGFRLGRDDHHDDIWNLLFPGYGL